LIINTYEIPPLEELLGLAKEVAREAGRRTLDFFGEAVEVHWKADGSPRTLADLEAEDIMRRKIRQTFPRHGILGEERGVDEGDVPIRWILDPIDGTQSFIRGVPLFGTLVGVEVLGEPVIGVTFLPALDELISAAKGMGCMHNGRLCRVSTRSLLREALVVVSDQTAAEQQCPAFPQLIELSELQRTWGDCYAYMLVATGRAEVALDHEMSIWDNAALLPIIEEAGGRYTDWSGLRTIETPHSLATNGLLHDEVLSMLSSHCLP
jgi:histidinol-phosphatase